MYLLAHLEDIFRCYALQRAYNYLYHSIFTLLRKEQSMMLTVMDYGICALH